MTEQTQQTKFTRAFAVFGGNVYEVVAADIHAVIDVTEKGEQHTASVGRLVKSDKRIFDGLYFAEPEPPKQRAIRQ